MCSDRIMTALERTRAERNAIRKQAVSLLSVSAWWSAGLTNPLLLDHWTGDGAVGAEDAAVTGSGPEVRSTLSAVVDDPTGDRRHLLPPGETAPGTGDDRFRDDDNQTISPHVAGHTPPQGEEQIGTSRPYPIGQSR